MSAASRPEPYPYARWPRLDRAHIGAAAALRALAAELTVAEGLRVASQLLGVPCEVDGSECEVGSDAALAARSHAVWLELERSGRLHERIVIELPLGPAELLVDRTLGGDGVRGTAPSGLALDDMSLGVLAYLGARLCAALGGGLCLRAVGPTPPADWVALARCALGLRLGDHRIALQVHARLEPRALRSAPLPSSTRHLEAVPISLWADAGHARLDLATLRSLELGDVVVLDHSGLIREGRSFSGQALVRVEGSAAALVCSASARRLEVVSITCTPEPSMTTGRRIAPSDPPATTAAAPMSDATEAGAAPPTPAGATTGPSHALASDAPIELRLEIARFSITLGELARLQPGDVLATGQRIGEHVTLRANERAFAEGELVDVDGEVGIKLTRLLV